MSNPTTGQDAFDDAIDPLSAHVKAKEAEKAKDNTSPTKDNGVTAEKLKNVFGNELLVAEIPKISVKPTQNSPEATQEVEASPSSVGNGPNTVVAPEPIAHLHKSHSLAVSSEHESMRASPIKRSNSRAPEGPESSPRPATKDDEGEVASSKKHYPCTVANTDIYEPDRIEALYCTDKFDMQGRFKLGQYMLAFTRKNSDSRKKIEHAPGFFLMPWTMIIEIKRNKDPSSPLNAFFEISLKDQRTLIFKVNDPTKIYHKRLVETHRKYNTFSELYAFKFFSRSELEKNYRGWDMFNIVKEYHRQGLDFEQEEKLEFKDLVSKRIRWRLVKNFISSFETLCESYPEYLMIPSNISPMTLKIAIKFRSRNRFPVMTYYWGNPQLPKGFATLWRCSQCNVSVV